MDVLQTGQAINVLLDKDHPIVRDGIKPIIQSLSDDGRLLVAEDLESAMMFLSDKANLNLALVDLTLPDGSGPDFLGSTVNAGLSFPVVVFSSMDDVDLIEDALAKGAKGFITT